MEQKKIEAQLQKLGEAIGDLSSPPNQMILTNSELAELMKVSKKTLQKWRDTGLITYSKIGREIFYKLSDVLIMLDKMKVEAYK